MPDWQQPSRLAGIGHWETHDPDDATVALSAQQRQFRQEVPTAQGYRLSTNTAELEWLRVSSLWTPTPQQAWTEPDGRYYLLMFWNQGANEFRFQSRRWGRVAAGQGLLSTPHLESVWKSKGDLDVIVMSVPSSLLVQEAQNLSGRPLPRPLEGIGLLQKRGPIWRLLDRFLRRLEAGRFRESPLLRKWEQRRLITDLVLAAPHNIPLREERASNIPANYRLVYNRVLEFTRAHLTEPISLGDVAQAAGTSVRGVERAFRYSGVSWVEEWRKLRLEQARRMFLTPDQDTTVESVQRALGFGSRFPADYFARFREKPYETLSLGRRGRKIY